MCNEEEHIIGTFHDYGGDILISFSELKEEQPSTPYTMKQYLDWRCSTNLYRFNYCPICGTKIDWNKLKNKIIYD